MPVRERYCTLLHGVRSARCSGKKRCDDVGGVAVEGHAGSVVTHRRARVGVTGGLLDVAQRDSSVEGGGDERMAQGVGTDPLGSATSIGCA
jgi:hypothetical protein